MTSSVGFSNVDPVDLQDRVEALFEQESTCYKTADYLCSASEVGSGEPLSPTSFNAVNEPTDPFGGKTTSTAAETMSQIWREKMCEWAYQLVDHFDFSREIVSICMNYLDRYLSISKEKVNKKSFQLLAMTCLYLSIKLNQPLYHSKVLSMDSMIHLSRGYFTKEQMTAMEQQICCTLGWRLHPTTPLVFLRHYLQLLKPDRKEYHQILDLGRFFIELSVLDCFFLSHRSSTIAMATLLNAMEQLPLCDNQDACTLVESLMTETRLNHKDIMDCRERLIQLYLPNARTLVHPAGDDVSSPDRHNKIRRTTSPVSVVQSVAVAHSTAISETPY